jgi:hypothetical protein
MEETCVGMERAEELVRAKPWLTAWLIFNSIV